MTDTAPTFEEPPADPPVETPPVEPVATPEPAPEPESAPPSVDADAGDPPVAVPTPDTAGVTQPPGQVLPIAQSVGDSREVAARENAGLDTMEGRPLTAAALGHIRELEQMAAALESWISWLRNKIAEVSRLA